MKGKKITIITSIIVIAMIIVGLFTKIINNTIISPNSEQQKNATYNSLETYAANSETTYSIEWQKSIGSDYVTEFKSAVKTRDGGIIAVGSTDTNTSIDGEIKKGYGNKDGIIVKYSFDGTVEWSKLLGGEGYDELFQIEAKAKKYIKPDEEVYVVGGYVDSTVVEYDGERFETSNHGSEITDYGYEEGIVMTIDGQGNVKWVKTIEGTGKARINAVAINENDEVGVTGSYYNSITVNGTEETLTSAGGKDGFVYVFSNDGNYKWSKNLNSTEDVAGKAITAISDGFAVGVNFKGKLTVGGESQEYTSKGKVDGLVINFSSSGDCKWKRQLASKANDEVYDLIEFQTYRYGTEIAIVATYGEGITDLNLYVHGNARYGYYDSTLVRLKESNGALRSAIYIATGADDVINSIVPTDGGVLLGGWTYSGGLISVQGEPYGTSIQDNEGANEGLIIELSGLDKVVWNDSIQGNLYDCINDIVYVGDGSYYAVGSFNSKNLKSGLESINKDEALQDGVILQNDDSYYSDAFVVKYISSKYVPPKKPVKGQVTVHHVIKGENGYTEEKENLKETMTGNVGNTYTTKEQKIEHYKLESQPEGATGKYVDGNIDVYYYYVPEEYEYRVEYYYDNEIDESSTMKSTAKYNSIITEFQDKGKNEYKLVNVIPQNENDQNKAQLKITGDSEKNVIKVYYENTQFKTVKVKKTWEMSDDEAENYRATIQLMRIVDGEKLPFEDKEGKICTVQITGNNVKNIDNVPVYKGGNAIEYALKEIRIEKRKSPNEDDWEEVPLTQFNVSYQIVKGDENN